MSHSTLLHSSVLFLRLWPSLQRLGPGGGQTNSLSFMTCSPFGSPPPATAFNEEKDAARFETVCVKMLAHLVLPGPWLSFPDCEAVLRLQLL